MRHLYLFNNLKNAILKPMYLLTCKLHITVFRLLKEESVLVVYTVTPIGAMTEHHYIPIPASDQCTDALLEGAQQTTYSVEHFIV